MTEKILIILFPLLFIVTFAARNLVVQARTQKKVKASDPWLTVSITLTTICFFMVIASVYSEYWYQKMRAIRAFRSAWLSYAGFFLFGFSTILGWFISAQLKESWRVGVHPAEKTDLVTTGIYAYIRNPYFVSYFIMFLGLFLIRPSLVMAVLAVATVSVFHLLVIKEETHLMTVHGKDYIKYKNRTGRYFPLFGKGDKTGQSG